MSGLGDLVQKAVYLGVGLSSYAMEKAGTQIQELNAQAQKLAEEMVKRGEMTTEEARKFVDDIIQQAQVTQQQGQKSEDNEHKQPRRIEIIDEDEEGNSTSQENVDNLRQQVQSLQEELRRLKKD